MSKEAIAAGFCESPHFRGYPRLMYYVYGRDAEWKDELPPVPNYYMHQLHSLPPERMLNGNRLAGEMNKLLQQAG